MMDRGQMRPWWPGGPWNAKGRWDLLLERPNASRWPNGGGGQGMAAQLKSSHFETTLRRLCSPEVLMQPKITESRLTEAHTRPRRNSKSEVRNPKPRQASPPSCLVGCGGLALG